MGNFSAETFGKLNASDYDANHDPGTTDLTVALLADLFPEGTKLLELAIGTGRIALPLSALGCRLSGVEASQDMIDLMRAKKGGTDIPVLRADMAAFDIDDTFEHAFLIFNTLFNLTTQDAQCACFSNVARHLEPNGLFVIEAFVPDLSGFTAHQRVRTKSLDMTEVWLEAATHEPTRQLLEMQRVHISGEGVKLLPLPMRYAYPSEIDLMARLAGFELEDRWGGWDKSPFTAQSTFHISVYRKVA